MQSMGEGQVCDRRGWVSQSFCLPYLPVFNCAELCSKLGEGTDWSLTYTSSRGKGSSNTLGGSNSVSATRFSALVLVSRVPLQEAAEMEWGQGVPYSPLRFSMLEVCGKGTL